MKTMDLQRKHLAQVPPSVEQSSSDIFGSSSSSVISSSSNSCANTKRPSAPRPKNPNQKLHQTLSHFALPKKTPEQLKIDAENKINANPQEFKRHNPNDTWSVKFEPKKVPLKPMNTWANQEQNRHGDNDLLHGDTNIQLLNEKFDCKFGTAEYVKSKENTTQSSSKDTQSSKDISSKSRIAIPPSSVSRHALNGNTASLGVFSAGTSARKPPRVPISSSVVAKNARELLATAPPVNEQT